MEQEKLVKEMLIAIGENPERLGLQDTPKRVVKMWKEIFRGYDKNQKPKITTFPNNDDGIHYDQMITDTGTFYSQCEHHMAVFFGKYWFAYIPAPNGNIIGLSKVARVVEYYSARLQVQERLVHQIVNELWKVLTTEDGVEPLGMGLLMEGTHTCKCMRGIKKEGKMTTTALKGIMLVESKQEFLDFTRRK